MKALYNSKNTLQYRLAVEGMSRLEVDGIVFESGIKFWMWVLNFDEIS